MANKEYLGDGVYIEETVIGLKLFTSDGITSKNEIFLEPEVLTSMLIYLNKISGGELFNQNFRL